MANLGITDWNGSHYRIMGTLALTGLAVVGSGMEVDAQVWGALLTVSIALASELLRDRHRPYLLFLIAPLVAGAPMFFPAILITLLNMPLRYLPLPSFFYLSALSATAPSAVFTGIIGIALAALIHKLVALYTSAVDEYLHENDAHFEYERLLRQMEENRAREIASSTRESILAERNRIARSLHDYIGHTVSSAIMQLEAYKALYFTEDSPAPEDRNAEYRNVEDPSAEDPNAEDPSAEDPNAEDPNAENRNTECSNIREPHADSARAERLSEPSPSGAPPFAERSAAERLESVIDTLKSGMVDVRSGIHHLYDESLDLEMSIQRLAEKYPALRFRLIITNTESLRYQTKNEIFRMLCELVSNTVKHSDATQIASPSARSENTTPSPSRTTEASVRFCPMSFLMCSPMFFLRPLTPLLGERKAAARERIKTAAQAKPRGVSVTDLASAESKHSPHLIKAISTMGIRTAFLSTSAFARVYPNRFCRARKCGRENRNGF